MRKVLVAVAWTVLIVIIYALAGCGEVQTTKEIETSGFLCFGFCTQKTAATQVEVNRVVNNAKK